MNLPFTPPELTPLQSYLVRTVIKLVAIAVAAHGATKLAEVINATDTVELVIGLVAAILAVVSGAKSNTTKAIQQKAADTLPVGTVLPATTDAQPTAQVMSPEGATEFIRKSTPVTDPVISADSPSTKG
jgi:hypothetical protein